MQTIDEYRKRMNINELKAYSFNCMCGEFCLNNVEKIFQNAIYYYQNFLILFTKSYIYIHIYIDRIKAYKTMKRKIQNASGVKNCLL